MSTLDDGELVQGQVTAVIALEQLAAGTVGHYGYGQGAQSPLPALSVMTRRSVARAALGMGGATALSRACGFVRVLVIAAALGTTYLGNTFQATNSVSNVLFELLAAGALSAVLVPDVRDADERRRRRVRRIGSRAACSASR